jgi:hypothetical protein
MQLAIVIHPMSTEPYGTQVTPGSPEPGLKHSEYF